jgi:hypothetical protein
MTDMEYYTEMKRRNFLGCIAAFIPTIKMVDETKIEAGEPKEVKPLSPVPALKADRYEAHTDICFFCDSVGHSGSIVEELFIKPYGMDPHRIVRPGHHSGVPVGMLLNDVVEIDLNRHPVNYHKDEVISGSKVRVMSAGWVAARCRGTPKPNLAAYYDHDGMLTTQKNSKQIGRFLSTKDEDGFAKVLVEVGHIEI